MRVVAYCRLSATQLEYTSTPFHLKSTADAILGTITVLTHGKLHYGILIADLRDIGCLPFTQKIRKFRMECKWKDYFILPERKFPRENGGRLPFHQNFRCEFPEISMGEWYSIFRLTAPECKSISPFHSHFCPQKLKMADSLKLWLALELFSDLEFIIDELMVDDDDIIVLSAIGRCYTRRNLNRIYNLMEITVPCYLPDEFKSHFRLTRETCKLFAQEAMRTGRIPLGNTSGRPAIPPRNQEPARAVADRFNITMSSVNRILIRLSQAAFDLSVHYIKWPDGD